MSEVASLVIAVDSTSADGAVRSLRDLAQQGAVTEAAVKKTGGSGVALKSVSREADVAARAMDSLASAAKGVVATLGVGEIIRMSDTYQKYNAQLKLATTSTEGFAKAQEDVRRIARTAQAGLEGTATLYARIANSTRDLGVSQAQVAKVTEAISLSLRVSGATAEESASAMLQLSQAFSSGVLRGEEFNAVNEAAPRLMKALADGMNVPIGALRQMAQDGQITADIMVNSLLRVLGQVREESEEFKNIGGSFTNLKNAVLELVGTQADASGFVKVVTTGLDALAKNLDTVIGLAGLLAGARLAGTLAGIATNIKGVSSATLVLNGLATAATAARGALAFIGGSVGLLTAALGLGASAWISYKNSAAETKSVLDLTGQSVDSIKSKIDELSASQLELAKSQALEALARDAEEANKTLRAMMSWDGFGTKQDAAAFNEFRRGLQELAADSTKTADQVNADMQRLINTFAESSELGEMRKQRLTENAQAYLTFKKAIELSNAVVKEANDSQRQSADTLDDLARASRSAAIEAANLAMGIAPEKWQEYIAKLDAAATVVGMNAQQMAEYSASVAGASEDQAKLAGVLAATESAARDLEKATREKDIKAQEGAKAVLEGLVAQEVQMRLNIKRAQEYASMVAMGFSKADADYSAGIIAAAMGPEYEREALARVESLFENIKNNTVPEVKKATKSATDAIAEQIKALKLQAETVGMSADKATLYKLATEGATKAQLASAKAALDSRRAGELALILAEKQVDTSNEVIKAALDEARRNQDLAKTFGMSAVAIEQMTVARLEHELTRAQSEGKDQEEIDRLKRLIELRKENVGALVSLEAKEAEKAAWEQWSRDVEGIFQQVSQSLTDAIFEGGKSGRDLVKDLFKTLTLRVLINPVMNSIQGAVTNSLGGVFGFNNPQQGGGANVLGMAQNAQSMYSAYSGGLSSTLGQGASWLGKQIGSEALSSFGLGLTGSAGAAGTVAGITSIGTGLGASLGASIGTSAASMATTTFSASLAGTSAAATAGTVGSTVGAGAAGAGMSLGAAIPYVGLAIGAASLLSGLFGDDEPKTRHGQWEWAEMSGDNWGMKFRDSRQPAGTGDAITQYARSAVDSANATFGKLGVNAAIEYFYATTNSSVKGDRNGVASGGTLIVDNAQATEFGLMSYGGDRTKYGFGGWSKEEMLPRLQTDIQLSILQAFQTQVDKLPTVLADIIRGVNIRGLDASGAQALAEQFNAIITGVDMLQEAAKSLPFEQLRDLSFDAAAGIIQFAGGLDNLNAGLTTYYENFYSEAEKQQKVWADIDKVLEGVGLTAPKTRDSFRELVEAQDLTTEAGQRAYVALLGVSGAFAQVSAESERLAEQKQQDASAERGEVIAARRAIEKAQQEAFDASVKAYEEGAKPFEELRTTLLSAGDAAGLLGATIERALSSPLGKYMAGGREYDLPRWESDTIAARFNYEWGVMQMRIARDLSDDISANALRIENAGSALRDLTPNLGEYGPVVGPLAQALTTAVVDASGDMGYAVRDSVYQAMLGVAQQDVYSQFASRGAGLADIRYAQQQAGWASQAGWVRDMGMQFGADVVAYGNAVDKLSGRLRSGQITTEQYESAVDALNRTMPTAAELLGDTEAQLQRMADAAREVSLAGARSIDHYFGELRKMAQELEKTEEPINKATAAIGRMNSFAEAFGVSAAAAGDYSSRTGEAALIAQAAGIAASVLTTADARKAAEELAKDAAFAGVGGTELRDMALLVDGIKAFDPDSWERSMIRMSDALGQGVIDEGQFAALFNYSLDVFEDVFEDTARTAQQQLEQSIRQHEQSIRQHEQSAQQLEQSFDRLRDAAESLADELLLDRDLTTLSFGQQYAEAQRQYQEVMRRAMGGDADAAGDLDRVTRNFLERSADSRDEIQYRRDFAVAVNSLRQIETSNPMKEMATEIKRLNQEVEGLRADLRAANATVASNTNETTRELRRINATGIKVQA
ncbi:MAG: tape measure protein [Pusillimonas sp.]